MVARKVNITIRMYAIGDGSTWIALRGALRRFDPREETQILDAQCLDEMQSAFDTLLQGPTHTVVTNINFDDPSIEPPPRVLWPTHNPDLAKMAFAAYLHQLRSKV